MILRVPPAFLSRWGRYGSSLLLSALLYASCTPDEDTEPHVPAVSGAQQPDAAGALLSEEDACDRLLSAAQAAYDRLGCEEPMFADCPAFLRPGGGSGCYEYREGSIEACEEAYGEASSCRTLSPCLATAELNLELVTCEQVVDGVGGAAAGGAAAGGAGPSLGGAAAGGEPAVSLGGNPGSGGAPAQAGSPSAGAPAAGAAN